MPRIARIPSLGLLIVAAALVGCSETPAQPSSLDVVDNVAARGANVGIMTGSWTGSAGVGAAATATLVESGSRISGSMEVTNAAGILTRYAAEGIENKGQVYLNLFDGVNLPQPIVGSVSGKDFSGTLNGSVVVTLSKK